MYVLTTHPHTVQIAGQLLRHALGQGRHQNPLLLLCTQMNFCQQVVYLVETGTHFYFGIGETSGTNHLFHNKPLAFGHLVISRRSTDVYGALRQSLKLLKFKRPVVQSRRQPKTVLHQILLATEIAPVHGPDLGNGNVTLINHRHKIIGEIIQQTEGTRPREATVEVTTVILNTGTVAQLPYHLQVIIHPLLEPFCFQALAFSAHPFQMQHQVILNVMNGLMDAFLRRHKNIGRINQQLLKNFQANVVYRIKSLDPLHLVAPKNDATGVVGISQINIHRIALHPKMPTVELYLIA